jgi:pimeloyl-ACP methyl ester carboxylesterase
LKDEQLPDLELLTAKEGSLEYAMFYAQRAKPLLIVVHGLGGNAHSIKHMAQLLKGAYSIVGVSLPFHGKTFTESPLKANSALFSILIGKLLDKLSATLAFPYCTICAHSIGAIFAIQAVLSRTKIFKNMVLAAPAGFGSTDQLVFKYTQHSFGKWLLSQDLFLRYFANKLWKTDDAFSRRLFMNQLKQLFTATEEFDLVSNKKVHLLYGVSSTVSIIWAKDDAILPYHYSTEVANHFQRSSINLLNDGGHNLFKTRPDYLAKHLLMLEDS